MAASEARGPEDRAREPERLLGRKTMGEALPAIAPGARPKETLKEALAKAGAKGGGEEADLAAALAAQGRFARGGSPGAVRQGRFA